MSVKCKCGKDAVIIAPNGEATCVRCYKIIKKENIMEERLLHNIIELERKLKLYKKKLHIAKEGLKVISSNGLDKYDVASKTLDEINNI